MIVLIVSGTRCRLSAKGRESLRSMLALEPVGLIIVGDAEGVDLVTRAYCAEHNIACEVFPADWDRHGRRAGPLRNQQMIERAVALRAESHEVTGAAFPGGSSVGTWDCMRRMVAANIPFSVWPGLEEP